MASYSYITREDLERKLGKDLLRQLSDPDRRTTEGAVDRVAEAIDFSTGQLDMYTRALYVLPLKLSPVVKQIALDCAIYDLYKSKTSSEAFKQWQSAYDRAIKQLEKVAAGSLVLDSPLLLVEITTRSRRTSGSMDVERVP